MISNSTHKKIQMSKIKIMSNQNNPQNPGPLSLSKTATRVGIILVAATAIVAMNAAITYVEALWKQ